MSRRTLAFFEAFLPRFFFLPAYGQEDNFAQAFDMSAAEYVVKPVAPTELAVRTNAALWKRKHGQVGSSGPYTLEDLKSSCAEREVIVGGSPPKGTRPSRRIDRS